MADREVKQCNRLCCMNDPDKGCLLGGIESCRIGSETVIRKPEEENVAYGILDMDSGLILGRGKSVVQHLRELDEDGAARLIGYLCMSFADKVNELHGGEPVELSKSDMFSAYFSGYASFLQECAEKEGCVDG